MNNFVDRVFIVPLQQLLDQMVSFMPNLLAMFFILGLGIAVAIIARWLLGRILKHSRFDELARHLGLQTVLHRANLQKSPSELIANLIYGLILLVALLLGLTALNLQATSQIIVEIFVILPKLIVSILIIIAGYLLSQFLGRSVLIAAVNAEWRGARMAAYSVQTLIVLFTVSVSLEQLGLGRNTIIAAFSILFGGIVLGLAIAFGFGGRHLAREFLEARLKPGDSEKEKETPFSHL